MQLKPNDSNEPLNLLLGNDTLMLMIGILT